MLGVLERGLTLRDFELMTFGMITGFIVTYNNERIYSDEEDQKDDTGGKVRLATQADFDRF